MTQTSHRSSDVSDSEKTEAAGSCDKMDGDSLHRNEVLYFVRRLRSRVIERSDQASAFLQQPVRRVMINISRDLKCTANYYQVGYHYRIESILNGLSYTSFSTSPLHGIDSRVPQHYWEFTSRQGVEVWIRNKPLFIWERLYLKTAVTFGTTSLLHDFY